MKPTLHPKVVPKKPTKTAIKFKDLPDHIGQFFVEQSPAKLFTCYY